MATSKGLLASSADFASIKQMIGEYYCSPNIELVWKTDHWIVCNSRGHIAGVRVVQNRTLRYRFERCA